MTSTTDSIALETVPDYHRAWTSGNVEHATTLMSQDVACRAPGEDLVGKDGGQPG